MAHLTTRRSRLAAIVLYISCRQCSVSLPTRIPRWRIGSCDPTNRMPVPASTPWKGAETPRCRPLALPAWPFFCWDTGSYIEVFCIRTGVKTVYFLEHG